FSPSIKRLQRHYDKRTLYRLMDQLHDLGLLTWEREKNHYGPRIYQIKVPRDCGNPVGKQVSNSLEQVSNSLEQVSNSQEQVSQLCTPSVFPPPTPSKEGKIYGAG